MAEYEPSEVERMLGRFRRLLGEVMRGTTARSAFEPWEMEILLDLSSCELRPRRRLETLRQYGRAVERQLSSGVGPPLKFSEFLVQKAVRAGRLE